MNIIFGKELADSLSDKYTVLELDTIQFGNSGPVITAYCAVECIPIGELYNLDQTKQQHEHLMINYRGKAWQNCLTAIDQLTGRWQGELDSFYADLRARIESYITNPPATDWSAVIQK